MLLLLLLLLFLSFGPIRQQLNRAAAGDRVYYVISADDAQNLFVSHHLSENLVGVGDVSRQSERRQRSVVYLGERERKLKLV